METMPTQPMPEPTPAQPSWDVRKIGAVAGVLLVILAAASAWFLFFNKPIESAYPGEQPSNGGVIEPPISEPSPEGLVVTCDYGANSLEIKNEGEALSAQHFYLMDQMGGLIDSDTLGEVTIGAGQTSVFPSTYDLQQGEAYILMAPGLSEVSFRC